MKFLLLIALAFTFAIGANAQKLKEGKIVYKIAYEKLPAELESSKSMLPNEAIVVFNDKFSKTTTKSMAGDQIVLHDKKNEIMWALIDLMGNKVAIADTISDEKSEMEPEFEVKFVKGEKKEIAGYACKKAEITMKLQDQTMEMEAWYTGDLQVPNEMNIDDFQEGALLEYTTNTNGMLVRKTATSVNKEKVDAKEFELPEGYKKMTKDEFAKMMGGAMH